MDDLGVLEVQDGRGEGSFCPRRGLESIEDLVDFFFNIVCYFAELSGGELMKVEVVDWKLRWQLNEEETVL